MPITVHLDHCLEIELVKYAASLPFDSIIVDMSHYDKDENLRLTRELTEYCHERSIATEAEPGRIDGGEDGLKDTADLEGVLRPPSRRRSLWIPGLTSWRRRLGTFMANADPRDLRAGSSLRG